MTVSALVDLDGKVFAHTAGQRPAGLSLASSEIAGLVGLLTLRWSEAKRLSCKELRPRGRLRPARGRTNPGMETAEAARRQTTPGFAQVLRGHGLTLRRAPGRVLQVNVGKLCNQACQHCHVDAGPLRTEIMERETVEE